MGRKAGKHESILSAPAAVGVGMARPIRQAQGRLCDAIHREVRLRRGMG